MSVPSSVEQQVLAFLLEAGDEPLPNEIIAHKLGVSAGEALRAIEALRARGYRVETREHAWRVIGYPEHLGENELEPLFSTREIGRVLKSFDEVTSTSEVAWRLAEEGAPNGLVVVADRQTQGKGRLGRTWESPGGCNLYVSVVLRPSLPPARAPELTLVAAVAMCEAIRETGCERARIKWPNDIEIGGRKAAGVLTELNADADGVNFVILGMGIDVNMTPDQLSPEVRDVATSVRMALGHPFPRARLLARLLDRLESWLDRHEDDGFAVVRARWTALSSTVGARVRLQLEDRIIEGRAEGIDDAGHLLVRVHSGELESVIAGDVQTLRADH